MKSEMFLMPKYTLGMILVIIAFLLFLPWINRPFTGHHDFTGAFYSQMARNYLRYGLIATRLGQVTNFGEVASPSEFTYHTHHPPGVPLMLAGVYAMVGEHEWAARMMVAVFALGAVFLLFLFVAETTTTSLGIIATILTISTPLFVYTSILPEYEAPALFLTLVQFYSFLRLTKTGNKKYLVSLFLAAFAGYVTAWVAYFAVPILLLNELRLRRIRYLPLLLVLIGLSASFFGLHLLHTKWLTGDLFGGGLRDVFLKRVGAAPESDPRYTFSTMKYVGTLGRRLKDFYGYPLLIASVVGCVVAFLDRNARERKTVVVLFTGVALTLPVLFRNYVFVHDYMLFYSAPILGFLEATGLSFLVQKTLGEKRAPFLSISFSIALLISINLFFTKTVWRDLWESKMWYEASPIIGGRLRRTTRPGQSILLVNPLLREQETQLAYYADRQVSFPSGQRDDPDVIVNVAANFQFSPEYKEQLLNAYRLEVDRGVEYYYRK